jgi:hypothetical protein
MFHVWIYFLLQSINTFIRHSWYAQRNSGAIEMLNRLKTVQFQTIDINNISNSGQMNNVQEAPAKVPKRRKRKRIEIENLQLEALSESVASPTSTEKLSREEKKIAMLMKSFQRIENRQNRKRKGKDPRDKRYMKPMDKRKGI